MALVNGESGGSMGARADLHTHTTASDGLHTPADVVQLAKEAGLQAVAITDHDTVAGIQEALEAGTALGIEVVPGVELSTVADGADIHILAYYADHRDSLWLERLESLRTVRDTRNQMMIDKLNELGLSITLEEVMDAAREEVSNRPSGATVGRPHIAAVLVRKGYVADIREAFDRYLKSGAAAHVNPPRLHPFEALEWIREAGGTSVIAHPGLYGNDALVEELIKRGVQGIEVYHSDHSSEDEQRYSRMVEKYSLIATGGSDFHGSRQGEVFHGWVGNRTVSIDVLRQLKQLAGATETD